MRSLCAIFLFALTACSSEPAKQEVEAPAAEKKIVSETDRCLDNPELARSWGDCNVKQTLYLQEKALAKCRNLAPKEKGVIYFDLRVKGDGHVKSARTKSKANAKLVGCLKGVMKKLQFVKPPHGKASIQVPYQLE